MASDSPQSDPLSSSSPASRLRRVGLLGGPLIAIVCYQLLPTQYMALDGSLTALTPAGRATVAVLCWMALWWMTEALPIEATSLLPVAVFPLFGVANLERASAPYGSDVIFLFLGGFVLAAAIQRWGLDRRIAYMALKRMGTQSRRVLAGVMGVTAFLSMWVSNTATAAMMVPIARAIVEQSPNENQAGAHHGDVQVARLRFARALMLAIAYAASIGGIGTIIGSPPNGILVRFMEQTYGWEISFAQWMTVGIPVVLLMLPLTWWLLTRIFLFGDARSAGPAASLIDDRLRALGPVSRAERLVLIVFASTALLWMFRPLLVKLPIGEGFPFAGLSDAGIAVGAAIILFLLPAERASGRPLMDWQTASRVPWGVLILFGGGLSLAAAIESNGVAQFIGAQVQGLGGLPVWVVLAALVTLTVFLSEVMSNTAQVVTMIPLIAALAPGLGLEPLSLVVAVTLAASCAFMLPAGTPPNAIVFGTGYLTIPQMCRTGFWLNLIGILVVTAIGYAWVPMMLTPRP